jgi:hypothetical protein
MSWSTTKRSSWCRNFPGISPARMRQKRQDMGFLAAEFRSQKPEGRRRTVTLAQTDDDRHGY